MTSRKAEMDFEERPKRKHRSERRQPHNHRGREGSEAPTSQGMPTATGARRSREMIPGASRECDPAEVWLPEQWDMALKSLCLQSFSMATTGN